eukprot:15443380-Alexandrium_andersonii.AAC.1
MQTRAPEASPEHGTSGAWYRSLGVSDFHWSRGAHGVVWPVVGVLGPQPSQPGLGGQTSDFAPRVRRACGCSDP